MEPVNFSLFGISGWGIDLDYCDVCLGNKPRSFCCFWDCVQVLHFRLSRWFWGLLHFFYGILAHSSRYKSHLNWIHPFLSILVHCFLRCPCLCTLVISCMTMSNLPWFMEFQVLMKYCSLQHQILLPSPDTSTTELMQYLMLNVWLIFNSRKSYVFLLHKYIFYQVWVGSGVF